MLPPPPVAAKAKKPKAPPKAPKVAKPKPAPGLKVAKPKKLRQSLPKVVVRHLPPPRALAAPTMAPHPSSLAALLNHDGPREGEGSKSPSPYTFPSSPAQLSGEASQPEWDPNLDPQLQQALQSLLSTSPDPPPINAPSARAPIDYSSAFAALAVPPILPNGVNAALPARPHVDVARTSGGRFDLDHAAAPVAAALSDSRYASYPASPATADPFAQYFQAQESTLAASRTRTFGDLSSGGSKIGRAHV